MKKSKIIGIIMVFMVMVMTSSCKGLLVDFTLASTTWQSEVLGEDIQLHFKNSSEGEFKIDATSTDFIYTYDNSTKTGTITPPEPFPVQEFSINKDKSKLTVKGNLLNLIPGKTYYLK